jgi:hypothetical protein
VTARAAQDPSQRIAEKGREALHERLRAAFEEAAAAHREVLALDAAGIERMVQQAVDRADGLQWRRALATAATEELGIGLGEALGHPAVARAQKIVGAPSYEEGLAAVAKGEQPPPGSGTAEAVEEDAEPEVEPAPLQVERGREDGLPITVGVVHLDGLRELEGQGALELHFSEQGLEVIRLSDRLALVSFAWSDVGGLGVEPRRGRRWRRRGAQVIIGALGREQTFDAPDVDAEELRRRLAPVIAKLGSDG